MSDTRRKFLRFNFEADVEFRTKGDLFSGRTKNVSREGISFISQSCSVDIDKPLHFQMRNPRGEAMIEACADIAWQKQRGDECHLGLCFKDINKTDKSELLDVAYDNWLSDIRNSQ